MESRAISANNNAVTVAANALKNRSTVVTARRGKRIFTGWLGDCRGMGTAVLGELGSPDAARIPR